MHVSSYNVTTTNSRQFNNSGNDIGALLDNIRRQTNYDNIRHVRIVSTASRPSAYVTTVVCDWIFLHSYDVPIHELVVSMRYFLLSYIMHTVFAYVACVHLCWMCGVECAHAQAKLLKSCNCYWWFHFFILFVCMSVLLFENSNWLCALVWRCDSLWLVVMNHLSIVQLNGLWFSLVAFCTTAYVVQRQVERTSVFARRDLLGVAKSELRRLLLQMQGCVCPHNQAKAN